MNPKYRMLYLLVGFAGLFFLIYDTIITLPEINPLRALLVALPDLVVFFLAYKTYPVEQEASVKTSKVKSY
ncbi:hypothetical protein [Mucilaginibacter sp. L3T2-6]|uniref:hypothetical protein n=1 Tax=Mucilaginibacter sp. L3T2-6 TaxID=3062491 RepID=UPI002674E292|nr:hypothetical protein [Mucilaginibacter sp. L3T2-6]MDO3641657.1 hypothetical protein [Mucilaginibacter sp. L3T2-6]MDV6214151.1 hypothetical protein [Mucilaginibacter sp. L3T2-6]